MFSLILRFSQVLAKVLAAVVKFDNNQTKQILEREEQKLSLVSNNKYEFVDKSI